MDDLDHPFVEWNYNPPQTYTRVRTEELSLTKEDDVDEAVRSRYQQYGSFRLLDLPIEIRNIIYRHAIPVSGHAAVAMYPTSRGYSVQSFTVDELEGMKASNTILCVAASGLHDASKKIRAEVTTVYRTSFSLVLPDLNTISWVLKSLRIWGTYPYLKLVTLKVYFAPNVLSARDSKDTLMEYFTTGSKVPNLEHLTHCPALARVHFDISLADCNQHCQIGPIFETKARRLLGARRIPQIWSCRQLISVTGSEFTISARSTTCDHCPIAFDLRSTKDFTSGTRDYKRVDANRTGDPIELIPSSAVERWKWTCARRSNVWNITRFKYDIESQKYARVVGLSDLIGQYRRDAAIDKVAAKQKLQVTAQEMRNSICDTIGCSAACRNIPTDLRYARACCCRYCELAWFCPDHYFVGQHTFRGKHWMQGYCIKRPLPATDGMVHMAPMDDITQDRIYDTP